MFCFVFFFFTVYVTLLWILHLFPSSWRRNEVSAALTADRFSRGSGVRKISPLDGARSMGTTEKLPRDHVTASGCIIQLEIKSDKSPHGPLLISLFSFHFFPLFWKLTHKSFGLSPFLQQQQQKKVSRQKRLVNKSIIIFFLNKEYIAN